MLPCVAYLTDVIFEQLVDPDDVAALVVEPILGEGGYIVPPPEFLPLLRSITRMHGIVFVVDEIQTGLGRTGEMFASDHWEVEPDIVCIAKAIASGIPLGAVVARANLMDAEVDSRAWKTGSHGSTFGGNPVACAAALKTMELIESKLVQNARTVGGWILKELKEFMDSHRIVGDVRGKGLMIGVEIVKNRETKERLPAKLTQDGKNIKEIVMGNCFKRGLVVLGCGVSAIRFSPPLILSIEDAKKGVAIFEDVIEDIEKQLQM
jgi:4-aminobutyrate aminotransferase